MGNLKNMMIENKLDFEEQEKMVKAASDKLKSQVKDGFIEIDESDEELNIIDESENKKNGYSNLKRVKLFLEDN